MDGLRRDLRALRAALVFERSVAVGRCEDRAAARFAARIDAIDWLLLSESSTLEVR